MALLMALLELEHNGASRNQAIAALQSQGAGHNRKSFFRWLKSVKGNPKTDLSRYITIADGKHYVQGRANAHYIAMVPVFASTTTCLRHIAGVLLSERPPLGWV